MIERESAIIVSLDRNGDVISVEFAGYEKLTEPTFNVFADSLPDVNLVGTKVAVEIGVCPTFYTRSGPVIGEPCSIKSAMSSERYLIA